MDRDRDYRTPRKKPCTCPKKDKLDEVLKDFPSTHTSSPSGGSRRSPLQSPSRSTGTQSSGLEGPQKPKKKPCQCKGIDATPQKVAPQQASYRCTLDPDENANDGGRSSSGQSSTRRSSHSKSTQSRLSTSSRQISIEPCPVGSRIGSQRSEPSKTTLSQTSPATRSGSSRSKETSTNSRRSDSGQMKVPLQTRVCHCKKDSPGLGYLTRASPTDGVRPSKCPVECRPGYPGQVQKTKSSGTSDHRGSSKSRSGSRSKSGSGSETLKSSKSPTMTTTPTKDSSQPLGGDSSTIRSKSVAISTSEREERPRTPESSRYSDASAVETVTRSSNRSSARSSGTPTITPTDQSHSGDSYRARPKSVATSVSQRDNEKYTSNQSATGTGSSNRSSARTSETPSTIKSISPPSSRIVATGKPDTREPPCKGTVGQDSQQSYPTRICPKLLAKQQALHPQHGDSRDNDQDPGEEKFYSSSDVPASERPKTCIGKLLPDSGSKYKQCEGARRGPAAGPGPRDLTRSSSRSVDRDSYKDRDNKPAEKRRSVSSDRYSLRSAPNRRQSPAVSGHPSAHSSIRSKRSKSFYSAQSNGMIGEGSCPGKLKQICKGEQSCPGLPPCPASKSCPGREKTTCEKQLSCPGYSMKSGDSSKLGDDASQSTRSKQDGKYGGDDAAHHPGYSASQSTRSKQDGKDGGDDASAYGWGASAKSSKRTHQAPMGSVKQSKHKAADKPKVQKKKVDKNKDKDKRDEISKKHSAADSAISKWSMVGMLGNPYAWKLFKSFLLFLLGLKICSESWYMMIPIRGYHALRCPCTCTICKHL